MNSVQKKGLAALGKKLVSIFLVDCAFSRKRLTAHSNPPQNIPIVVGIGTADTCTLSISHQCLSSCS